MDKWDRDNLNFLLNADKDSMEDWYLHASDDDYKYALELLAAAKTELLLKEQELLDDETNKSDLAAARDVLQRFML